MPVVYIKREYYDEIVRKGEKPEKVINDILRNYLEYNKIREEAEDDKSRKAKEKGD